MVKWTNAGGQTKRANERSFVYRPPAWRRWRNVKTTYNLFFGSEQNSHCKFFWLYIFSPLLWWHPHPQSALRPSKLLQGILLGLDNWSTHGCSNQLLHTETQLKYNKQSKSIYHDLNPHVASMRTESRRRFVRAKGEISRMRAHEWRKGEVPLVHSIQTNPKN